MNTYSNRNYIKSGKFRVESDIQDISSSINKVNIYPLFTKFTIFGHTFLYIPHIISNMVKNKYPDTTIFDIFRTGSLDRIKFDDDYVQSLKNLNDDDINKQISSTSCAQQFFSSKENSSEINIKFHQVQDYEVKNNISYIMRFGAHILDKDLPEYIEFNIPNYGWVYTEIPVNYYELSDNLDCIIISLNEDFLHKDSLQKNILSNSKIDRKLIIKYKNGEEYENYSSWHQIIYTLIEK